MSTKEDSAQQAFERLQRIYVRARRSSGERELAEYEEEFEELIRKIKAPAWSEGAAFAAVETGAIRTESALWEAPGDNPYREDH